mmetsp:Transcript_65774/g.174367  ORF Transcript_65774/g.174367 Transcript_65774/m.174367 type:complete len:220 (-) Transcript_65774:407-1066(-)
MRPSLPSVRWHAAAPLQQFSPVPGGLLPLVPRSAGTQSFGEHWTLREQRLLQTREQQRGLPIGEWTLQPPALPLRPPFVQSHSRAVPRPPPPPNARVATSHPEAVPPALVLPSPELQPHPASSVRKLRCAGPPRKLLLPARRLRTPSLRAPQPLPPVDVPEQRKKPLSLLLSLRARRSHSNRSGRCPARSVPHSRRRLFAAASQEHSEPPSFPKRPAGP